MVVRVLGTLAIAGEHIFVMVVSMFGWLCTHTISSSFILGSISAPTYGILVIWPQRQISPLDWEILIGMGLCVGWSFGGYLMLVMWHWRRWWLKSMAFVPYVVAAVTWAAWFPPNLRDAGALATSMLVFASFQALGVLAAFYMSRPVSRFIIRIILPPRCRGELVYLWQIDGKTPPDIGEDPKCSPSPHSSPIPTTSNVGSGAPSAWASASVLHCDQIIDPASSVRV